jgi:hypothetical protein
MLAEKEDDELCQDGNVKEADEGVDQQAHVLDFLLSEKPSTPPHVNQDGQEEIR